MRRALIGLVVFSAIGTLVGCKSSGGSGNDGGAGTAGAGGNGSGGGNGGGGAGGGPIPVSATAMDIATTVCPKAYQCCTSAQLVANPNAGTTEAECETSTTDFFRNLLQTVQSSQDAQRCRYEQSKVDACLSTIRTSTCAMLNVANHLTGVPNCDSFTTPLVATGGVCTQSFECIDGVCQKATGAIEGTCGPGASVGQSCVVNTCAPALICDPKDRANTDDDVCAQPLNDGTACTDAVQCRSGTCAAPASGGADVCMAGDQCFYSGCAAAGAGATPLTLLIVGAWLTIAALRPRRSRPRARP